MEKGGGGREGVRGEEDVEELEGEAEEGGGDRPEDSHSRSVSLTAALRRCAVGAPGGAQRSQVTGRDVERERERE